jgi:hypothetical protein
MPCVYTIHKDRRLVVTTASGEFTFAEGLAHEEQLYRDPDFDPTYSHLIDASQVTKAELNGSELSALAQRTRFSPQSHKALVVNSTVLFGLARMYEAYLQLSGAGEQVSVFRELSQAKEWLGIEGEL